MCFWGIPGIPHLSVKNLRDNTCMGWTSTIFLGVDFQFMYDKRYWDVLGITPDVFINAKCFETLELTMWTNSKNSFWIQAFWSYRLKTKWKSSCPHILRSVAYERLGCRNIFAYRYGKWMVNGRLLGYIAKKTRINWRNWYPSPQPGWHSHVFRDYPPANQRWQWKTPQKWRF
jgi:hypothetical protein